MLAARSPLYWPSTDLSGDQTPECRCNPDSGSERSWDRNSDDSNGSLSSRNTGKLVLG